MKTYTIHLIRHATSEGNLAGRYIGRTESPLCMEGIQQLIGLKNKFKYPNAVDFYASPSTRCVDSLRILYPEITNPMVILEMAECDFGDWENKTAEELQSDPNFIKWMSGEPGINPPNGESSAVFMQRVCSGFEKLVQNLMFTGKTSAVLVTHAGVIMTILAMYGYPKAKMTDWMMEEGNGYSIRIDPSLWGKAMVCEVFETLPIAENEEKPDTNLSDIGRGVADFWE